MWQSILYVIPEAYIHGANQLAMIFGYGPDDGRTFEPPNFQDASGNKYAARFVWMPLSVVDALQQPLQRPAWDSTGIIDMDAAAEAQAALVFPTEDPLATPFVITALVVMDGLRALAEMGLTAKETA